MILVTGGAGFLGKRLIRKLVELGHKKIRCIVRPGSPRDIYYPDGTDYVSTNVEIFPASFNDKIALKRALEGVNIVYHAAASKMGSAAAMVANTVIGSDNLYQASVDAHVSRFVLVSSFAVIGVAKLSRGTLVDETVPMEDHPEWRDAYCFSKQRQELLAWRYFECKKLPLLVIRPGVIFGPGNEILGPRIGLKLFGVFLHCGGTNQIPLTYVDNCAEAIALAGTLSRIDGEVFCIVDDNLPESRWLLRRYCQEVTPLRVVHIPYRLARVLAKSNVWYTRRTKGHLPAIFTLYEVDSLWKGHGFTNQKAKRMLDWYPRVAMRDAIDKTLSSLARTQIIKRQHKENPSFNLSPVNHRDSREG